jgi:hypothetical protein
MRLLKAVLDKALPETLMRRRLDRRAALLLPAELNVALPACVDHGPLDANLPRTIRECAVLPRIGREFVQRHGQHQGSGWRQEERRTLSS